MVERSSHGLPAETTILARAESLDLGRRATSLRERLTDRRSSGDDVDPEFAAAWRRAVAPAGSDWLEKRLRWDGITLSDVSSGAAGESGWLGIVHEISEAAGARDRTWVRGPPVAFQDLLLPIVQGCAKARLPGTPTLLAGARGRSRPGFPRAGLTSRGASAVLGVPTDFAAASASPSWPPSVSPMLQARQRMRRSLIAISRMGFGRCSAMLSGPGEAPRRGRPEQWVGATTELIARIEADRDHLCRAFGLASPLPPVGHLEPLLGDRHQGGRSVTVVTFADGTRLVYKPKSLSLMDVAFNGLIDWCNARLPSIELRRPRVLARGPYGWTEYIRLRAMLGVRAAAGRFYRRAGALMCLLHVTRATDCHFENLVAHGEHPVLVDTGRTILHPDPAPTPTVGRRTTAGGADEAPVTSLSCGRGFSCRDGRWTRRRPRSSLRSRSALGSGQRVVVRSRLRWEQVNTDAMSLSMDTATLETPQRSEAGGARAVADGLRARARRRGSSPGVPNVVAASA